MADDVAALKSAVSDLLQATAANQQQLSEILAAEKASQLAIMAMAVILSERGLLDCREVGNLMRELGAGLTSAPAETVQSVEDFAAQFDKLHDPGDPPPPPRKHRLRLVK